MRTPPYAVYVSPMPPAAVATLAETMVDCCPDVAGVTGTAPEADAFVGEWARRTGARLAVHMRQRMYRLSEVAEVGSVPGIWRPAALPDRDLLVEWSEAFHIEANEGPAASMAADVDLRLAQGRAFVWVDGTPVSYVGTAGAAGSVVRVGPVYTPPDRRGHGYASALVAAVSRDALHHGATACMLYTDVANRTSNAIYFTIGYRPVCEVIAYHFSAGPG
jgi:predicted GNAT family acetyltransferase